MDRTLSCAGFAGTRMGQLAPSEPSVIPQRHRVTEGRAPAESACHGRSAMSTASATTRERIATGGLSGIGLCLQRNRIDRATKCRTE